MQILDLMGVFAFAVSGALLAIRRDFDVVGIAILAVVTALGGGIIRDLVLGDTPPPAFTRWEYLVVALAAAAITSLAPHGFTRLARPLLVFDAAGLGLFTVAGTQKALDHGLAPVAAACLGVTTAAGGGVLRDVIAREVPALVRADSELYAVPAVAGALVIGVASTFDAHSPALGTGVAAAVFAVRVLALQRHWRGPRARGRRPSPSGPSPVGGPPSGHTTTGKKREERTDMTVDERYDVVVVGGGAAGLSGALALSRARRRVLVVDAGSPRNSPAGHVHNVLGQDGTPPAELVAIGRREVEGYGGTVVDGHVSALSREDGGFRVDLAGRRPVRARRLLVATGLTDELPDVPGVAELWGRSALHCPYCHGWEVRDRAIGVLGSGPQSTVQALLWRQWSDDVILFPHTGSLPTSEEREQLAARGVRVVEGEVTALDVAEGALCGVRLASGEAVPREALVVAPRFTANAALLAGLGIEPVDQEVHGAVRGTRVPADPTGRTEVPGVWVAGNAADVTAQVMAAAAHGMGAATAINVDLVFEDVRAAVEQARTETRDASSNIPGKE